MRPRTPRVTPEEYHEALELAQTIKQTAKRVKNPVTAASFVAECKEATGYFRTGGMMVDAVTYSMVSQVWDHICKHEKGEEFKARLERRFALVLEQNNGRPRAAIADLVDRCWRIASPTKATA